MKKTLLAILLVLYSFLSVAVYGQDFDLDIRAAILVEAETGQVLYEKNSAEPLPPASITKIMTLLLAMEEIEKGNISLDSEVTISKYAESMGGSQIYLEAGTRIVLEDLLKAVTIASANDASVAIAEAIGGTYSNFIRLMNKKAEELGMENTIFENSTGLPVEYGDHHTTAYDIILMSRELIKYDKILEWGSIWVDYVQLPGREAMLVNTNRLINSYPGMDGLKTGYTKEAGYCLAATAERNDMRLISVILGAETEKDREELTARLLDYGFNTFEKDLILRKGEQVHNIDVPDGKKTVTSAEVAEDLYVVYKRGTKGTLQKEVVLREDLKAPIEKGEVIGQEFIVQEGEILAQVDLLAVENIEKAGLFTRLWRAFVNWVGQLIKGILN
ncbi:MAG: D-alanyl-D-alanine carboxypeptidase [Halanaerobiaceae bacterium]|nr:D-alanyl-D-alanine carboxypeptidase [Halanaerobiaceae bacterium]